MRRKRRRVLWLGVSLLVAAVAVCLATPVAVGYALTRLPGTRPQDRALTSTPAESGLAYRTVFLRTGDGVRISGWLIPAPRPQGCSVVMAHGLFRSRREVLSKAVWLAEDGCAVLAIDLRRHGESAALAGGPDLHTSLGLFESQDVLAGAKFLADRAPGDRLWLFGISMGAAAAARAGVVAPAPPAGVVLDSVFRSVPAAVDRYAELLFGLPPFPTGDLTLLGMRLSAGFRPEEMDVERYSRRLGERGVPVLVIAGLEDEQAPAEAQVEVFHANRHPASRLLEVPGATHGRPCLAAPSICRETVRSFFGLAGPASQPTPPGRYAYDPGP